MPLWVGLQYLCYHNTFVSAIIHNTFATIPLSTIPYTGIPGLVRTQRANPSVRCRAGAGTRAASDYCQDTGLHILRRMSALVE